ncbi:F-box only protein 15 [Acropora cervicornis]|uniref:F-box only protein 15 n=1 Tax=Acropora cervicornis TaxID=6130 RepID=A0AAD9QE42_ACRCE|nr:F-box only protein 15 [Acropora cervicornis]
MSRHHKHLTSYLKSKKSGASTSQLPRDRAQSNEVGATFSIKSAVKVPVLSRTKNLGVCWLPDEILLKIFKFLTPSELLVCAQVCHQWTTVTKESSLWKPLLPKFPKQVRNSLTFEETQEKDFNWKEEIIKRCKNARNKEVLNLRKRKKKSPYTGLPNETSQSLKPHLLGDARWKLCITDSSGKQHWSDADSFNLFASSVCIRWYTLQLPPLSKLKMLQVFAFLPVFYHRNWTPHANRGHYFERQTLMYKWSHHSKYFSSWNLGCLLECIFQCRIFVPPPHKPVQDDIDPNYGLHSYSATIELRNHLNVIWGRQYRELYQMCIGDTYVCLGGRGGEHGSFEKRLSLPWKTELFKDVLHVTLLLGYSLTPKAMENSSLIFNSFQVEDEGQTLVTNVELRVLKTFINSWFKTSY